MSASVAPDAGEAEVRIPALDEALDRLLLDRTLEPAGGAQFPGMACDAVVQRACLRIARAVSPGARRTGVPASHPACNARRSTEAGSRQRLDRLAESHSWGSVSVTEFIKRSAEARASIAGIITSGSKYEIEVQDGVNLPILFLHHERDGCKATPYGYALRNFEKTRSRNKGVTELATVKGGEHRGDPCRDGLHMYFGAYEEAAKLVEQIGAGMLGLGWSRRRGRRR